MPAPIEPGRRQREERRIIGVAAYPGDRCREETRAHAVVELPEVGMDHVEKPFVGRRERLGRDFRPGEESAVILIVGAVELAGSPPMAEFPIDGGIAEEAVTVRHYLR